MASISDKLLFTYLLALFINPLCSELLWGNMKYVWIFYHFLKRGWCRLLKSFLVEDKEHYVLHSQYHSCWAWWRHQMETFSTLLAICAGNLPVPGEFPAQRPVTWSFDVFFDLGLNKQLSKQCWGWWFEMLLCPLWRHTNGAWWCLGPGH